MVERQDGQLLCTFDNSTICPQNCDLNSFRKTMRARFETLPGMVSDVLKEREEVFTTFCEHKKNTPSHI